MADVWKFDSIFSQLSVRTLASCSKTPCVPLLFLQGDQLDDKIDFIMCLGGDGTLLHASSLFQVSKRLICKQPSLLFSHRLFILET